ncbi:hypothetical protein EDC96DRAFT_151808 [Choanephora cucurbitarum]|nr:hypothetical protein EDC96DRAFT_151808 [Choanephora cucurbitarum]
MKDHLFFFRFQLCMSLTRVVDHVNDPTQKRCKLDLDSQLEEEDDDSYMCTICSETWSSKGEHCLVSLKCGHLFGKKCIVRWIMDRSRKLGGSKAPCPMCMKAARQSDIRIVIPTRLAVKDITQSDLLKRELEALKIQIKESEKELELARLGLSLHKRELEKAKRQMPVLHPLSPEELALAEQISLESIMEESVPEQPSPGQSVAKQPIDKELSSEQPSNQPVTEQSSLQQPIETTSTSDQLEIVRAQPIQTTKPQLPYSIVGSKRLSETRQVARVMALNSEDQLAYISFKSNQHQHGIMTLDLATMTPRFTSLHDSLVRDVRYSHVDKLILSTGLDKTAKLGSLQPGSQLSVSLSTAGWSCCFDALDANQFYIGLADSTIVAFDRRYPAKPYRSYQHPDISKTPLHSLFSTVQYHQSVLCGANLTQPFFYDTMTSHARFMTWLIPDDKPYSFSRHAHHDAYLLSCRSKSLTRHYLFQPDQQQQQPMVVHSPFAQRGLTRTHVYGKENLADSIFCYAQEERGSLCLYQSGRELQQFQIHSAPLDIQAYDQDQFAFLTDNRFFLLQPTSSFSL